MKLAIVNDMVYAYASNKPQAVGGAERQQWLLGRSLAAAGWSVSVGVRESLQSESRSVIDGVQFVALPHYESFCAPYQRQLSLHRFLRSERPDWFFSRGANYMLGPAVEIAKSLSIRTIFSAAVDGGLTPRTALFSRPYCWPLYAWGLRRSDKIFVQHEGQLLELPPRLQLKASILPQIAVPTISVKPHCERDKYVAWVAMFREPKRPDVLVDIARRATGIRFVVCGGPTRHYARPGFGEQAVKELRALPNVEYRGQVSSTEARYIISNAALFLSTSIKEGFPNTFLDAWSAGTPVISMHCDPGCIIKRFGLGTISPTVERALEDITTLMESIARRRQIAASAQGYIAENHSVAAAVAAFVEGIGQIAR